MNTALMTATPPDLALPIRVGIVEDDGGGLAAQLLGGNPGSSG